MIQNYLTAWVQLLIGKVRDERGLSQSTENALLVVGAVGLAIGVVAAVTAFVTSKMAGAGIGP